MINVEQIRVLRAVVEAGSFRGASETMYRSQPALTIAIQKLEDTIGFELFDREAYRATLTPRGEAFYNKAKLVLKQTEALEHYADHLKSDVENEIGVAFDCCLPLDDKTLGFLEDFLEHYPNTHFRFFSERLGGGMERLQEEVVEIAICENLGNHSNVEQLPLFTMNMIPVISPQYLEKHRDILADPNEITDSLQVLLSDSSKQDYQFGVIESARHWTTSSLEAKLSTIRAGIGWGRMPSHMVKTDLQSGALIQLGYSHTEVKKLTLSLIRTKRPFYGPIATRLWEGLSSFDFSEYDDGFA